MPAAGVSEIPDPGGSRYWDSHWPAPFARPRSASVTVTNLNMLPSAPFRALPQVQALRKYTKVYDVPGISPHASKEDLTSAVSKHWSTMVRAAPAG